MECITWNDAFYTFAFALNAKNFPIVILVFFFFVIQFSGQTAKRFLANVLG